MNFKNNLLHLNKDTVEKVIAYTLLNTSWLLVWLFFVRRLIGYGYWMFFCDVMPFALAAAGVMVVAYVATMPLSNLIALLI